VFGFFYGRDTLAGSGQIWFPVLVSLSYSESLAYRSAFHGHGGRAACEVNEQLLEMNKPWLFCDADYTVFHTEL